MHLSRRLMPLVPLGCFLALAACGGQNAAPVLPTSADAASTSGSRTTDTFAVTSSTASTATKTAAATVTTAAVDESVSTPDDQPIPGAAPPEIAGTYTGTLQDRTPSAAEVDRGAISFTLHQTGSSVSGSISGQAPGGPRVLYRFTGTAAATPKGAILDLAIMDSKGEKDGMWAKVIGSSLFGQGWVDPNGTGDPYEQLIFSTHKT